MLDFQRVKLKEKVEAKSMFEGKSVDLLKKEIELGAEKVGVPSETEEEKKQKERINMIQVLSPD